MTFSSQPELLFKTLAVLLIPNPELSTPHHATYKERSSKKSHKNCDPSLQNVNLENTSLWKCSLLRSHLLSDLILFRLDCSQKSLDLSEKQKLLKDAWYSGKERDSGVLQNWIPRLPKPHFYQVGQGETRCTNWLNMSQSQEKEKQNPVGRQRH